MEGKDTDKSGDGDSAGGELSSQPIGEAGTVNFLSVLQLLTHVITFYHEHCFKV